MWKPHEWGLTLKMQIHNMGDEFINAAWVRLGGINMPLESELALPHGAGFIVPLSGIEEGKCVKLHYPVFASMQWLDLFDENRGVYLGVCDELPRSKIFSAGIGDGAPFMEIRFSDLQLEPQERYEFPELHFMAHKGDWRVGSAHYKDWFDRVFKKPAVPGWCFDLPAWAWALCKQQYAEKPDIVFSQLSDHLKGFAELGIPTLQISGYLEKGHDALFPDYKADPCMGGECGLRSGIQAIQSVGGRLSLYTNARVADPDSSIGACEGWKEWCVSGLSQNHLKRMNDELRFGVQNPALHPTDWDKEGICYKEKYGQVEFAIMCPSCNQWRKLFVSKLIDLVSRYRPDGIYIDQICGAWGLSCYNQNHEHKRPCDAWCGYTDLLGELRTAVKKIVPDIYLATEGVNDILGIGIDIFQAHNWDFRFGLPKCAEPAPEIFISTLPQYLLYLGPVYKNDVRELRRAFAYGRGFDIAIEDLSACDGEFVKELDFAVSSRHLLCPGLLSAAPRPVPADAGVRCFLFILPDGRPVVLGSVLDANETDSSGVMLPPLKEFSDFRVRVLTPHGEKIMQWDGKNGIAIDRSEGMWMILRA
jgi:hypothetical protein